MNPTRLALSCLLGAALPLTAVAAITTPRIVVTPHRTPVSVDEVAASTTVITRQQIEDRQAGSVPELIRGVAGIDVVQSGGPGKATSFFLRGTEADHVLVLINGIRVGAVSLGLTAFEQLPIHHIEQIEIVRGPRASQWGSEAIGGVIHIFTRSGKGLDSTQVEAGVGAGSFGTFQGHASVAGSNGDSHYAASVGYLDTDGFDARQPIPGDFGFDQPDDDGYDNLSFHLRGGHRFSEDFDAEIFMLRAAGTNQFDGSFQDETDFVQQVLGAKADWWLTDTASLRLRVGESRDEQENFAPEGAFAGRFDSKRQEASAFFDFEASPGQIVNLGVDYRDESIESNTRFAESSRDNIGVFAQYIGNFGNHNLTASVRHDDNEAFGSETTGGLGWSVYLPSDIKLYASYGTAFKAPSFNELYFPGFGNPGLEPETSESVEAGIEGRHDWGAWGLRAYRNEIDDLIATVFDPVTGTAFPENVDKARITGVEAEMSTQIAGFDVSGTVSLIDPEDLETGNQLPRRPETAASLDINRSFERLRVGGRLLYRDGRFDNADNTVRVDSYVTVDLTAEYELRPGLMLRGKIGNLFDEDYQEVDTFNTADRYLFVSLLYRNQP